jgi:hypothetical protein
MAEQHHYDRRAPTAVTEFSDGNGGRISVYNFSIAKWKTWAAFLATLLTIGVTVFGAVMAGVKTQVRQELEVQIGSENSPLNRHILAVHTQQSMNEHAEMTATIRDLQLGQTERRTQIIDMQRDLGEMRADLKELLRRVR